MKIADRSPGLLQLASSGPLVSVRVGRSAMAGQATEEEPPQAASLEAKIDTGSFATVIPRRYLDEHGFETLSALKVNTASHHDVVASVYLVSLEIEGVLQIPNCHVLALDTPDDRCLIGRDLLAYGVLMYYGRDGAFQLDLDRDLATAFVYPSWLL